VRRVVITGLGGVTPIGIGVHEIWGAACAGRSGIGPITLFDVSAQACRIAGEVRDFEPSRWMPAKHLKRMDDFARYAVATVLLTLSRLHEKKGTDVFVASYTVAEKEDGTVFSYAVWTRGVPTLLPKADWIAFGSVDDEDKGTAAIASWDKAEQIVGHLMQPTDLYPLRVHVTDFPTPAELAELGMAKL
jgi:hypothetical protein